MIPFRAARSSSLTAWSFASTDAPGAWAFLRAVRSAERCARLRTVAARDLRMFFFAEAIFGTKSPELKYTKGALGARSPESTDNMTDVKA
jgi:hypothetical protein